MRRKTLLLILILVTALAGCAGPATTPGSPPTPIAGEPGALPFGDELQGILDDGLVASNGAGISAAVIVPGYEPWVGVSGYSAVGPNGFVPMRPDMLFEIASIDKNFVAVLMLQLVDCGQPPPEHHATVVALFNENATINTTAGPLLEAVARNLIGMSRGYNLFTRIYAYDLVFVLAAIAFNLLIAGLFVAQRNGWAQLVKVLGVLWLLLVVPFAVVFVRYWTERTGPATMVRFGLVFLYILVEFLLDYVFKVDFRRKWITHAPYIVLEYIALFSLIGIAFGIDRTWGYLVAVSFWILMASLIYLYWDTIRARIRKREKVTPGQAGEGA